MDQEREGSLTMIERIIIIQCSWKDFDRRAREIYLVVRRANVR